MNKVILGANVLAALIAQQVHAQSTDTQKTTQSIIEEVTVTAEFREANLQETPIAISAMSGDMMEARGISNVTQVAQSAPNVTLQPTHASYGKSTAAYIRGIGQFDANPALEPGVGIYIDDVYFGTVFGSAFDLIDTDRVEILRGPQGTLSGKNSIGGAIKLFSRKPQEGNNGYLEVGYGSFERAHFKGATDLTIVPDRVYARISGVAKSGGGYIDRKDFGCANPGSGVPSTRGSGNCDLGTLGGDSLLGARVHVLAEATEKLTINFIADGIKDESENPAETMIGAVPSAFFPGLDASPFVPADPYVSYASFSTVVNPATGETINTDASSPVDNWGTSLTLDYALSENMSLKSITAHRQVEGQLIFDDHTPLALNHNISGQESEQFSQEIRLSGMLGNGSFLYTLGAFYFDNKVVTPGRAFALFTFDQVQKDRTDVTNKAVFAHTEFSLTEKATATFGLRYTEDEKDYMFVRSEGQSTPYGLFGLFGTTAALNGTSASFSDERVDWRVALNYQLTGQVMAYTQVGTGFKGGGVNPRPFYAEQVVPFDPEEVTTYEIGLKSQLFDNSLRLNTAVFYSEYDDILLTFSSCPQFTPPGQPPLCNLTTNGGNAEMKGVEVEAEWLPVERASIDISASYLDFEYTDVSPLVSNLGSKPPYTPSRKLAIGAQYEIPMGSAGSLTPRLDYMYQSEAWFDAQNLTSQDGYGRVNARLTWRAADNQWQADLAVTNLTDKLYYLNKTDGFAPSFGYSLGIPARPREWMLTLKRSF